MALYRTHLAYSDFKMPMDHSDDDLAQLSVLDEATLLDALERRYNDKYVDASHVFTLVAEYAGTLIRR